MKCENIAKRFESLQKSKINTVLWGNLWSLRITVEANADHIPLKIGKTHLKDITSDNISVSEQQNCS